MNHMGSTNTVHTHLYIHLILTDDYSQLILNSMLSIPDVTPKVLHNYSCLEC